MNLTAHARDRATTRLDWPAVTGVLALGLFTLADVVFAEGNLGLMLLPLLCGLVVLAAALVPLRVSLLVLGFLCLTLENPTEAFAANAWHSPLAELGAVMLAHINLTVPVKALIFSGLDVALVLLTFVYAIRRIAGSRTDLRGHLPVAAPLRTAALLCIATIAGLWGYGMLQSGADFGNSLWQVFRLIYLPCVFLLFCAGLRGPADARPLGIALVLAALVRALVAVYVRHLFPDVEKVPHATIHADSMLFSAAFLLVLVIFFERPTARNLLLGLATLPILTLGIVANNRRLAWVELGIGLLVLYFITPFTRLKKRITQAVVISVPVMLIYLAAGWSSSSKIFAPVHTIRSVIDPHADASTFWRDLENYNLYVTIRSNPVLGSGLGHGYIEAIHLPSIASAYPLYRFAPHNSILGLFAYAGGLGFAGLWLIIPLGMFFAFRSYRFATTREHRILALTAVGILLAYELHCYGDMGLGTWASVFLVAPVLALTGKLAVATGAWPSRPPRPIGESPAAPP